MQSIAFIGLGNMGYPMAGHLSKAGHRVCVFNRSPEKSQAWQQEYTGHAASHIEEALQNTQIIITCVGNDEDLEALSPTILAQLPAQGLWIDHSTVSADISRKLALACAEKQAYFFDAPVSGGQQGAQKGQLSIFCGGDPEKIEQVKTLLAPYTKLFTYMGACGSGQLAKMVNQICVAGLLQGLAEGMYFAEQAGLDVSKVMAAISQGAAASWQMQNRYESMIAQQYEHGFAVKWMHKDLQICLEEAQALNIQLPVTETVDNFYEELNAQGKSRWDTSSLLWRMQQQKHNSE